MAREAHMEAHLYERDTEERKTTSLLDSVFTAISLFFLLNQVTTGTKGWNPLSRAYYFPFGTKGTFSCSVGVAINIGEVC